MPALVSTLFAAGFAAPSQAGSIANIGTVTIPAAIFTATSTAASNAVVVGPQSFTVTFSNTYASTSKISLTLSLTNATFASQSFTMTTTGSAAVAAATVCTSVTFLNSQVFLDGCQATAGQTITGFTFAGVTYKDASALTSVGSSIGISGSVANGTNTGQIFESIAPRP
jgi:hypothetical protein